MPGCFCPAESNSRHALDAAKMAAVTSHSSVPDVKAVSVRPIARPLATLLNPSFTALVSGLLVDCYPAWSDLRRFPDAFGDVTVFSLARLPFQYSVSASTHWRARLTSTALSPISRTSAWAPQSLICSKCIPRWLYPAEFDSWEFPDSFLTIAVISRSSASASSSIRST